MIKLSPIQAKAKNELWRRGELIWLLRAVQQEIYAALKEAVRRNESLKFFLNCSRRLGKSFFFCLLAAEYMRKHPEYPIRFGNPTIKSLKKIIRPIFRQIYSTAPEDCRPEWRSQDDMYYDPRTGGEINVSALNNGHADDLRGTEAGLAIVDECGTVDDLEYVIEDVLMPQLLTTGGNLVMGGTPPRTPAHPFTDYAAQCKANGNYVEFDIYKAGYRPEVVEKFKKEAGGENSTTWKREYLAQIVVDEESAIVPEWRDVYIQEVERDPVLFKFFHRYESMDIGGRDKNGEAFAYYDFPKARLIIEDEVVIVGSQMTSRLIARTTKAKERELWPDLVPHGTPVPDGPVEDWPALTIYKRTADNNNVILLNDLGIDFKLYFMPTSKDDLLAMVNKVRLMVAAGQILIHPRCKQLIGCLKFGIWNKRRDAFEQSTGYGHFDMLAALVYLVRNLDTWTNPIPANFNKSQDTHFIPDDKHADLTQTGKEILKMFGLNMRGQNGR